MLKAPGRPTDPLQLADWVEIRTLLAADRNASRMEMQSLLRLAAVGTEEEQERLVLSAFRELDRRATASGQAYPFTVEGSLVSLRTKRWQEYPVYVFCLLVSYLGVRKMAGLDAARLFEEIATLVASRYVGGPAAQFGFPRRTLPRRFSEAVQAICNEMREGTGFRNSGARPNAKDEALDIAAWRPFQDLLPGKLILFGQCAAGEDWFDKRSDLDPMSFCRKWLQEQPVITPTKAFFVPHAVEANGWYHLGCDAGIVFERCRIAYWSHGAAPFAKQVRWSKSILDSVQE